MAESFDPYYKWLGIPPQEQPPNRYRLLAINLFESDPDVIEAAADRQMSHLRGYQAGPHSAESQKLLNECAAARVGLLNPQKKAEYDRQLREKLVLERTPPRTVGNALRGVPAADDRDEDLSPRSLPRAKPLPQAQPSRAAASAPLIDVGASSPVDRRSARRHKKKPAWLIPTAGLGVAIALALVLWIALRPPASPEAHGRKQKSIAANAPKTTVTISEKERPRNTRARQAMTPPTVAPLAAPDLPDPASAAAGPKVAVDRWQAFDLGGNAVVDDFVHITQGRLSTRASYAGPIEITVVARAIKNSIRLRAFHGGVIWNWEDNPSELRVGRPDQRTAAAAVTPLATGAWYRLKWRITANETDVYVDDELVFHGTDGPYIGEPCQVWLETYEGGSAFDIKSLDVTPLTDVGADEPTAERSENGKYLDIALASGITMRLVKIPASEDGKIKAFYLGQTEVTQKQWQAVMGNNTAFAALPKGDQLPVTNVVFDEAATFCERVHERASSFTVRLPSYEEQQHAQFVGFAGDRRPNLEDFAWLQPESPTGMHAVATKRADALALYDMIGNANEWCEGGKLIAGGCGADKLEMLDARQTRVYAEIWKLSPNWHDNNCGLRVAAEGRGDSFAETSPPGKAQPPQRRPTRLAINDQPRLQVPDNGAQRKAKQELQRKISAEIAAARSPELKRKLAQELMHKGLAAEKHDAETFVTLSQAVELAETVGDFDLAAEAIDALAETFALDALARRQQSLTEVAKAAKSPVRYRELTNDACLLLADALAAEDAALAEKAAALAQTLAKRAKDAALAKAVAGYTRDAGKWADQIDAVGQARGTLKTTPNDASANFAVGHYELCAAGDYEHAMPKLGKSAENDWRKPAADDLEASRDEGDAARKLAAADAWWSRAEGEGWPGEHYVRLRAAIWYRRALGSLEGGERTRAIDRIKEALARDDGLPNWELFNIDRGDKLGTCLRLNPEGSMQTCVEYHAPMDITLVARTDSFNIRLLVHGHEMIWNWEVDPRTLVVQRPDGAEIKSPIVPLVPNRWYVLRYRIEPQRTMIGVDGLPVFTENHNYGKFPSAAVGVGRFGPALIGVKKIVIQPVK